ncbi:hydantoinase/oxoprolinase family protein [Muricomes intestini]|jgi:N-methylhydantoinase A/oxoprolinase/acetone carboxylase beta subunit|uniref:N-methylhydantoinase A/oxoprolinase/acetone carboxylase beta subunit n=2 Tax=Muricomes intestini TaxID=1796634 RepID=A0A4R3K910_9FIRM|nr:hydantoinase/oxoprolinase family protein [Muricomes intestini]TCS79504.1 N-methylhydantoinase A/oxoprolinase/acetone carboxylase beta subunit [Muricomes intestini]HAX53455.1 hydantoinase [Lachnospiraceae bacterium]HCR84147.1 hydantoinase [Lachnospiraceae bacterium]
MKVRIGIDVGGTFTDAVAINNDTFELIGSVKMPTTHTAKEGVAAGIVKVLKEIMEKYQIAPEDVTFIAHGTTQATNALLEGDVSQVGIITLSSGVQGLKAKSDTTIGDIELASGKYLHSYNAVVNSADQEGFEKNIERALEELKNSGAQAMVATEAFSVDNPENENKAIEICNQYGYPSTAGNDVSKLYGLKVRTRTAVINGSILPKMLDAANMTEKSIKDAGIKSPLMVMRCDGGVMTVDEVRHRPILTILSGPAAGVAGALMYEKLTDGIFFEVGGTSTDISCVKDGNVAVKYAEVGGHKTYLTSLDVRTVGIGGGSMIEIHNGKVKDVGPRSAHIADLDYEVFAEDENIIEPVLKAVHPISTDPEYAYIECSNGKKYALTLSGAANIAGYVPEDSYAKGNIEAAKKAWAPLAENMGMSVKETAEEVLRLSALKNGKVVESFIKDYGLDKNMLTFVGGGGGAATVVPHLGKKFGCVFKIAKNAAVISPIGVALAMVRDMVERTIMNPTEADILAVRREAERKAIASGANPETIEVKVEIDTQQQKVRAIAIGATELRTKELTGARKTDEEIKSLVAENLKVSENQVKIEVDNGSICAVTSEIKVRSHLFFTKKVKPVRLVDRDGVIRLQKKNAQVLACPVSAWKKNVKYLLEEHTVYGDGGAEIPNIYVVSGSRIVDMAGMQSESQILSLCEVELAGTQSDENLIMICTKTTENERG